MGVILTRTVPYVGGGVRLGVRDVCLWRHLSSLFFSSIFYSQLQNLHYGHTLKVFEYFLFKPGTALVK